ncbi:MAG: GDSL-type esterase/lipase family protein [Pseudoflavonifractor sp.]
MKKHIICLGDSNTHGYCGDPEDCADRDLMRFNEDERWTRRLQAALGDGYLVAEEGQSGRTTVFPDPLYEGLAAIDYLVPCLKSHEPVDLLILMLGTNDTKERFGANATCIALGMERLVQKAKATDCWGRHAPNILIIAPPVIDPRMETSTIGGCMGAGCAAKSAQLPPLLSMTAQQNGCHFLNAGSCEFNQTDYMHLTRRGHAQLAEKLAALVPGLVAPRSL